MFPQHNYHLVDPSPWPFFSSWALFYVTLGTASIFHFFFNGLKLFEFAIFFLILILINWWRDVIREGTFTLHHTNNVQKSLRLGMLLFIISELLLFVAFFWAFFHSSLAPTTDIGCVWPPYAITVFETMGMPLMNTFLLLTSGAAITLAHHGLLAKKKIQASVGFIITIALAIDFTGQQLIEFIDAPYVINDGVYPSTFFLTTGLHGLHVIVGTLFIFVTFLRYLANHFTIKNHFGFEAAAWYWHFVDVVWLLVFMCVYYWGNY